jgi:sRNA-binding carbon storage regulator CsrA
VVAVNALLLFASQFVAISEGRVKIGIEAPRDIPVNREEVLNRPNGNTR